MQMLDLIKQVAPQCLSHVFDLGFAWPPPPLCSWVPPSCVGQKRKIIFEHERLHGTAGWELPMVMCDGYVLPGLQGTFICTPGVSNPLAVQDVCSSHPRYPVRRVLWGPRLLPMRCVTSQGCPWVRGCPWPAGDPRPRPGHHTHPLAQQVWKAGLGRGLTQWVGFWARCWCDRPTVPWVHLFRLPVRD